MNTIPDTFNVNILGFADPISSWSHLCSALLALIASFYLIRKGQGNVFRIVSLAVYSFTLIFLFSMSGVYHLLPYGSLAREVLQRLDHAGIWALIAGTLTPIHSILFRGPARWLVLLIVWVVAITGLVLEVVYFRIFPQWLALSFFLGLGWVGTYSDFKFRRTFPKHSSGLIVFGGVLYSIGAAFDFMRWPNPFPGLVNAHEVFHFFVTIAALTHWLFIYRWCDYPVSDQIVCHIKVYPSNQFLIEGINDKLCLVGNCIESLKAEALHIMRLRYKQIKGHRVLFRYLNEEVAHQGGESSSNLI